MAKQLSNPERARGRLSATLLTVCTCLAVEAAIVLVLGIFMGSYLAALTVSVIVLGPASWWLAPLVYQRLLRKRSPA